MQARGILIPQPREGNNMEKHTLTKGNVSKGILLFVLPIIAGSLIQQLYVTIDAVVVGQFTGKLGLAAIDSVHTLFKFPLNFMNGLATGATILISGHCGSGDERQMHCSIRIACTVAVILGVVCSVGGVILTPWMLQIMSVPDEVYGRAFVYTTIYFGGIWSMNLYNMTAGILRAYGDSKRPLYVLVCCAVINIFGDLLLVGVLNMGVAGAALATVFSQCVSAFLVTWSLTKDYDSMKLQFRELRMEACVLKRELKIGIPGALQACAYGVTNVVIQASINSFGTDTAAGWAAYGKLDLIFWTVSSALGAAVTTFVGQNYGAGKWDRVYKSIRVNIGISYVFTGMIIFTLYAFCEPMYHMFTTDPKVIDIGVYMLRFLVPSYLLSILLENLDGGLRGVGDVLWPTIFTFGGLFLIRLPWVMILTPIYHKVEILLISYPIAWGGTLLFVIPYYFWKKKKCFNKICSEK